MDDLSKERSYNSGGFGIAKKALAKDYNPERSRRIPCPAAQFLVD